MGTTINTIIVLAVLGVVVALAIRTIILDHKSGGCSGCPSEGTCGHRGNCESNPNLTPEEVQERKARLAALRKQYEKNRT